MCETIYGDNLKRVEAIIREEAVDRVKSELAKAGFTPLTIYYVRGRGRQGGIKYRWPEGVEYYDLLPRVKIEIVVDDDDVDKVVNIIIKAAKRGIPGDGKIFITPVERVIRIRTGEEGRDALGY